MERRWSFVIEKLLLSLKVTSVSVEQRLYLTPKRDFTITLRHPIVINLSSVNGHLLERRKWPL